MFHDGTLLPRRYLMRNDANAKFNFAGGCATLEIHSTGVVILVNPTGENVQLVNCLYVPQLSRKLIPGGQIIWDGAVITVLQDPHFQFDFEAP